MFYHVEKGTLFIITPVEEEALFIMAPSEQKSIKECTFKLKPHRERYLVYHHSFRSKVHYRMYLEVKAT
jgi:hypothetical protein